MRTAIRVAILTIWLALVAILVRGERGPAGPEPALSTAAAPVAEGESWLGVYMGERKIGYSRSSFVPVDGGYRFEEQSVLRLKVLDTPQVVRAHISGFTGPDYALRRFEASIRSGAGEMLARGIVENRELILDLTLGGRKDRQRLPLDEPIFLPVGIHRSIGAGELHPGQERSVRVFDPMSLGHRSMKVRVEGKETLRLGGREVTAWKVVEEMAGMRTTVWLDERGEELEEHGPMGLVARREDPVQAVRAGWSEGDAFELMSAIAVVVAGEIEHPRRLRELDLRLGGIDGFPVPQDQRQRLDGGLLRIRLEEMPVRGFRLPYRGGPADRALGATPFVQSDDPRIRRLARETAPEGTDAVAAATAIRRWVYDYLEKVPVASVPNALQALADGKGDCNEHAVLFAALARAAGLPARIVAGMVYTGGVFLYHAWNEVWLGDGWVSVDATFDQMPADATHIKLVEGGPERHAELLQVIGRVSIDVARSG